MQHSSDDRRVAVHKAGVGLQAPTGLQAVTEHDQQISLHVSVVEHLALAVLPADDARVRGQAARPFGADQGCADIADADKRQAVAGTVVLGDGSRTATVPAIA